jgi:hypothetical protein
LIGSVRIWPVGLNCDEVESALSDQRAGEISADPIELERSMGGFADQDQRDAWIDCLEQSLCG